MKAHRSSISLNDFPDELLLMIFQNLTNIDVLYSLFGVNERFTRIVRDEIFVKHLTFVEQIGKDLHRHLTSTEMLKRLCSDVLPWTANQIQRFDVELSSIKEVFHAAHYPNLISLALYDVTEGSLQSFFTGQIFVHSFDLDLFFIRFLLRLDPSLERDIYKNQIRTLQLTICTENEDFNVDYSPMPFIAQNLFQIFCSLNTLIFNASSDFTWDGLSFENDRFDHFSSSTLSNLKITVENFDDCYYLFDGRFSQLESVDLTLCYLVVSVFRTKPKQVCEIEFSFSYQYEIVVLGLFASNETFLLML